MRSTIHFCALSNKNFASLPHVKNTKGWRTNSCCTHALHRFRFDKKESAQSNGIPLLDGSSIHRGREGLRLTEGYDAKNFPPRSVFLFFCANQRHEIYICRRRVSTRQRQLRPTVFPLEQHPRQRKQNRSKRNRFKSPFLTHRRHSAVQRAKDFFGTGFSTNGIHRVSFSHAVFDKNS